MKRTDIIVPITVAQYSELSQTEKTLVDAARAASTSAYAPYSRFSVGAAILLSDGNIVSGSNQENAAYPSGLCAERTAAFYAHSRYHEAKFETIAIAARDTSGAETPAPIAPCGACPVKVILYGADEIFILPSVQSLLPVAFTDFQ